jgi:acetoin utilization deacetylase AcuC-like enzyme
MRVFFPDIADIPLPEGHRFPAAKYRLLRESLLRQGILDPRDLVASPPATRDELGRAHDLHYVDAVLAGTLTPDAQRRLGLPWSPVLAERSVLTVGGTIAAARAALEEGVSGQLAGGTHHAHRDFGSGYCVFNDLAVTALTLLAEGRVQRIAIVDLDVHQGDGNSAILTPEPAVFVLSVQGARNFPFRRVPSDLDVELPDGTGDDAYLAALAPALETALSPVPDLVLYLAGADPLASDTLGRLALTHAGLMRRDALVLEACRRRAIPLAIVAGGGYAKPIGDTVTAYANTWAVVRDVFRR